LNSFVVESWLGPVAQVKMLRSFSEKVSELETESVSVIEALLPLFVFACDVLFLTAHEALVIVMQNVEIDPVDSRLS